MHLAPAVGLGPARHKLCRSQEAVVGEVLGGGAGGAEEGLPVISEEGARFQEVETGSQGGAVAPIRGHPGEGPVWSPSDLVRWKFRNTRSSRVRTVSAQAGRGGRGSGDFGSHNWFRTAFLNALSDEVGSTLGAR